MYIYIYIYIYIYTHTHLCRCNKWFFQNCYIVIFTCLKKNVVVRWNMLFSIFILKWVDIFFRILTSYLLFFLVSSRIFYHLLVFLYIYIYIYVYIVNRINNFATFFQKCLSKYINWKNFLSFLKHCWLFVFSCISGKYADNLFIGSIIS